MVSVRSLLINFRYMIHRPKPMLVVRTLYNYVRYLLGGPRLRYMDIIMDYACNLKCEHCSCETLKSDRKTLTFEQWGKVARQSEKLGSIIFGVQGGEPLIYLGIREVIQKLNPKRNFISVKTNGVLLTDEYLHRLKEWGVDSITVGLGYGDNFDRKIRAFKMISRSGIKPMLSIVVSHNMDMEIFYKAVELSRQFGSVLNCALAVPVGRWENNQDIIITEADKQWFKYITESHLYIRTDFETNWMIRGCGACKEKLYISPYGDVLPCPFIHISFGNVLEEPLRDIWRRACETSAFSEYAPVCLAAEDREFMKYLQEGERPIHYSQLAEILSTTYEERNAN